MPDPCASKPITSAADRNRSSSRHRPQSRQVTPRVCHTRPPTEPAQTTSFVEVDEITLANEIQRLFTGWMFAASPGLHAVEHPVYDVWLVDCKTQMGPEPEAPSEPAPEPEAEAPTTEDEVPED